MNLLGVFSDDKLSFMQYLVNENQRQNSDGLGRTALMKLVFLMQEGKGIPVGYNFRLYSYGPYDSEVLQDLEFLRGFGYLKEETVQEEKYQWKKYYKSDKNSEINENSGLLNGYKTEIDNLIRKYGKETARKLELYATTLFVMKEKEDCDFNDELIIKKVSEIKPKYSQQEIEQAFQRMRKEFTDICHT